MATTHHDINQSTLLAFREKRVEWLRRKQQPQTALERQRAFYYLLFAVAILCEIFDIILTFSGIIHFASNRLSENAYFIFLLIGLCVVLLGIFKHKTMDIFHAQRLDDGHVPKATYVFMVVFFIISAGATYNVTAPALEYLTKTPTLLSVDSVALRYDSLLAADLVVIAQSDSLQGIISKEIKRTASYKGKLDSASRAAFQKVSTLRADGKDKEASLILARGAEKEAAINLVVSKNEATVQNHKDWCVWFGFFLAVLFIVIEVLLYPAKWYCKDYEKKEVIEADAKVEAKGTIQVPFHPLTTNANPSTLAPLTNTAKGNGKKGKRSATFAQKVEHKGNIQIPQGEPLTCELQEGVVIPPQGKSGVHRVTIKVGGKVVERTAGELKTLMKAKGQTDERKKQIQNFINLLP